ncbi:MAG: transcription termination/antitermination protein NusG [Planctomycetaceae bacterium]|jgi:transcriptional antiterminator NusG|nr:transcription termination/antitermination protein NusG [Planctomycetaceae bacterium]
MVDQHDENHDKTVQETTGDIINPIVEAASHVETSGQNKAKKAKEKPEVKQQDHVPLETGSEEECEKMDWYILKVQVNREDAIKDSLKRKAQISGMQQYFDRILVPSEKVTEVRGGKKRILRKKLYPGYIMIRMVVNDDTWFLVRETSGIGDFTGSIGRPTPMLQHEVERILATEEEEKSDSPKLKIPYEVGGLVKIKEGTFVNFEGEVSAIDKTSGRVTVMLNIFGRSTPVELEYWQVELLQ